MVRVCALFASGACALACAPTLEGVGKMFPVSGEARSVKECTEIGPVEGSYSWWKGDAVEHALDDLKAAAASVGGNYVRLDGMAPHLNRRERRNVLGTAFLCFLEPR